ncbi:uncharacterized protein CTHT_0032550 [Thermochaetoides thermophila DSM 1495]|uniref:TAP42-like protein n=1 Tax=Chaetomium thermophilum (strain DSM 1495 / CBS 144.50 / IMI 039719) TaxID=759272 RepID=G0S579_CHATD|nr:hypothetical protein CTHT_0032550 [Thermochaetoides thermophila DSM 1495]EGS21398.1 hypothetical protein CTHT_0032550 [Thermochaetoides thermophila DSM 1495]
MDEPRSLKALWADAEAKRLSLETTSFPPMSTDYRDAVSSAITLYNDCLTLISKLSLFSPNESLEDLHTNDLPFLLTNFYLAELTQKLPSSGASERKHLVSAARDAYERFLHLLDSYGLLSQQYKKLLEQYHDSPTTFSTIPAASDPVSRRNAKIANYRQEKELKAKLEYLRSRPGYGAGEEAEDGKQDGGDEDLVRQVHLAHLEYSVHMTFQALESLNREWEILAMAPPEPSEAQKAQQQAAEEDARRRQQQERNKDGYSEKLDPPLQYGPGSRIPGGPLLSTDGKPLRPFTLVNSRQEIAKGVFRPGHNLPTMTIDEYLEEERRRGGIIEGGGEKSWQQPEPDEDNIEKADEETMKAREWDEFIENNPKGSGNTLNRG